MKTSSSKSQLPLSGCQWIDEVRILRFLYAAVLIPFFFSLIACSAPSRRPHFHRDMGAYAPEAKPLPREESTPSPRTAAGLREVAETYLGVPYRYGGESRGGMDCSGFVRRVFREAHGMNLPHNAAAISSYGSSVPRKDMQEGDLVFFRNGQRIFHVGIYLGAGTFIHSSTSNGVIHSRLSEDYYRSRFAGAKRLVGAP